MIWIAVTFGCSEIGQAKIEKQTSPRKRIPFDDETIRRFDEMTTYEAIIVGSGPNGLAAAITLAQAGQKVLVLEGKETIGGGTRTAEITLPGFHHDICSAIHPLGLASPFFRDIPLADFGLEWIYPPVALAHPLDDGRAALLSRSLEESAASLGVDRRAYQRLLAPLVDSWQEILGDILGPLPLPPRHPLSLTRFGLLALRSARGLAESRFQGDLAQALFAGLAGHGMLPLEEPTTASTALVLGMLAHAVGWPIPKGGSQAISNAMAAYLESLGGEIATGQQVTSLDELPAANAILLDVTPRQVVQICGDHLPVNYRRQLENYRYGPGVCKVDYALSGPIPCKVAACNRAGTVHLGGTLAEISIAEKAVWRGQHPEKPLVLLAQQSLLDSSRAPDGQHTAWAYCHVPHGSSRDVSEQITAQIERFAPGFRDLILAKHVFSATEMNIYNPNYIGGDINGGVQDWRQLFTRPVARWSPYTTPVKGLYICSSSTPPGGGVHGMCGYHAARSALKELHLL
jgi:phytoene dehydrogenase-like protein